MACTKLYGSVHTAQRRKSMYISIGFCTHFICIGLGLGVGQYNSLIVNEPLWCIHMLNVPTNVNPSTGVNGSRDQRNSCF